LAGAEEVVSRFRELPTHFSERNDMKTIKSLTAATVAATVLATLTGCAGMSQRDKNIAIGAGVGAVGGSVLTHGSTLGTLGGAAVGGVIGNEVSKDKR
jgi:osmotically inducible lipoprotein OsmB